jgi:hypothetical protein
MPSPDLPLGPEQFAQGVIEYWDFDPMQSTARIFIPVTFADTVRTTAIIDTASPWCILDPEEAEGIDTTILEWLLNVEDLRTARGNISGNLYRMSISLEAARGQGISIESKVLVPTLNLYQEWRLPNFIGFEGFLDMIRFAVDPSRRLFYFGSL